MQPAALTLIVVVNELWRGALRAVAAHRVSATVQSRSSLIIGTSNLSSSGLDQLSVSESGENRSKPHSSPNIVIASDQQASAHFGSLSRSHSATNAVFVQVFAKAFNTRFDRRFFAWMKYLVALGLGLLAGCCCRRPLSDALGDDAESRTPSVIICDGTSSEPIPRSSKAATHFMPRRLKKPSKGVTWKSDESDSDVGKSFEEIKAKSAQVAQSLRESLP